MVRIQLLGPVRAWRGDDELDLGGPKQQAVLALLAAAAAAHRTTSRTELIDALWPERPPASAANVIQTHLKHLRRSLEPDRPPRAASRLLRRVALGYTLDLSHIDVDLMRFRRLVAEAVEADRIGDQHRAAEQLREALRLWRGAPLADVESLSKHPMVAALSGERWTAVARYGEAMLAIGEAASALPMIEEVAAARPLDEGAHARLMRAHHALGSRGQAFATYQAIRHRLAEELGVDPGPELTAVYNALVAEDRRAKDGRRSVVPAQLPPATAMFTGRREQLQQLDKLLAVREGAGTVIAAIVGAAGIGKTTLAIRWTCEVADRFPDGQLFVNLRGFDPTGSVMGPGEAIRGFLDALQVGPEQVPATFEAQVGLYRSLLAKRRMLIMLDNARDATQVRPLLPGAPGCLVVVTSRDELTGLAAADGAILLPLDMLTAHEATDLLTRRLGTERAAAEPAALADIVQRCAGLPLALAIVAARAAARPEFGLATFGEELREASTGLDPFASGDPTTDLRAVLSWSYRTLHPTAARLFRQLAVHPGPSISTMAAASLAGVPAAQVGPILAELARAHLLDNPVPGRFAFHDLLRAYAAELASTVDSTDERLAATRRMLDHYLHSAHPAATALEPSREPITPDRPVDGVVPERIADRGEAHSWLATELRVLLGCVALASSARFDKHAYQLTWCLFGYLKWRGHWRNLATITQVALAAAARLGDRRAQASTHGYLASSLGWLGHIDEAINHYWHSLALYEELDDEFGQARIHLNFGDLLERHDRVRAALSHVRRSLALFRAAGNPTGEARALNAVAWNHARCGEHERALSYGQRALGLLHERGDRFYEGFAMHTVGYAHHHLGDPETAISYYERALVRIRDAGDRYYEARFLTDLGDSQHDAGNLDGARASWRAALAILDELDHSNADDVRRKLKLQGP